MRSCTLSSGDFADASSADPLCQVATAKEPACAAAPTIRSLLVRTRSDLIVGAAAQAGSFAVATWHNGSADDASAKSPDDSVHERISRQVTLHTSQKHYLNG